MESLHLFRLPLRQRGFLSFQCGMIGSVGHFSGEASSIITRIGSRETYSLLLRFSGDLLRVFQAVINGADRDGVSRTIASRAVVEGQINAGVLSNRFRLGGDAIVFRQARCPRGGKDPQFATRYLTSLA